MKAVSNRKNITHDPLILGAVLAVLITVDLFATLGPYPWLEYIFKPLCTIYIIVFAVLGYQKSRSNAAKWVIMGLIFSLGGDIALMFEHETWFLTGLGFFLLAHLTYIYAFGRDVHSVPNVWSYAPFLLIGGLIFLYIAPYTKELWLAVAFYSLAILTMAWRALVRYQYFSTSNTLLAFVGALLFLVSDSALAYGRFIERFPGNTILILVTYFVGQYLIAHIAHDAVVKNESR